MISLSGNEVERARHRMRKRLGVVVAVVYLLTLVLLCEYVIYYVVIMSCEWPHSVNNSSRSHLKAVVIADTHLLGFRHGHWFDKLRREWQMHRSFQTLMWTLQPDLVFFLGDLFDEGLWADKKQFNYYVERFHSLFSKPPNIQFYVVVGNHDIGFHYSISPQLHRRFSRAFNSSSVDVVVVEENIFVLVNSMALEGDNCFLCKDAEMKLRSIERDLKCAQELKNSLECQDVKKQLPRNSRPILLQHFPLYRNSDEMCEGADVAPPHLKSQRFREKWDCLSKSSTEMLLERLRPRLVLSGHTHHGCSVTHNDTIPEYSVPSFSWRNINNPSAALVSLTPADYSVSKCFLPEESSVIRLYVGGIVLGIALAAAYRLATFISRKKEIKKKY